MKLILLIIVSLSGFSVFAAQSSKIIEIQDKIRKDADSFINKFAPEAKYSVKVAVQPLTRRAEGQNDDDLPFMEFQEELYVDPWDDPKSDIYTLFSRLKSVEVTIFFEPGFEVSNESDFKEALLSEINLVPGRDSVQFDRMEKLVSSKGTDWRDYLEVFLLGIILFFAAVLVVILNFFLRKTKNSTSEEVKSSAKEDFKPTMKMDNSISNSGGSSKTEFKGDLNLQDPGKVGAIVSRKIEDLLEDETFPRVSDLIILEDLLDKEPLSFSYLIYEFPEPVMRKIYKKGRGDNWFKGFSEVGFPSMNVIMTLDRMRRDRTLVGSKEFEELLVCSWRLGAKSLVNLMKNLDKKAALNLLFFLPKDLSIPVAKECFPGTWGSILENNSYSPIDDQLLIKKLSAKCLEVEPYFDYQSLQNFKNKKDLLKYLDTAEPKEEKEIYNAMGKGIDLKSIRPPFYLFFELSDEVREVVYNVFSINEWIIACFNVDRDSKDKVTDLLSDKEKYIFSNGLRELDENPDIAAEKSQIRKKMARYISDNYETLTEKIVEFPKDESDRKSA